MKRNNKAVILVVLITAAVFAWLSGSRKNKDISSVTFAGEIPIMKVVPRKRTEFVDWGRNPFVFAQKEEKTGSVSNLSLSCIIRDGEKTQAFINDSLVRVGDTITDMTVKQIESDRVILTDGAKDYVLKLQE